MLEDELPEDDEKGWPANGVQYELLLHLYSESWHQV